MTQKQLLHLLTGLIFKYPKLIIFSAAVAAACWYSYEHFVARPAMTFMGLPQTQAGFTSHILRNNGFMLEYSETLKNPLWVTYKVTQKHFGSGKRPSRFDEDWRTFTRVSHQDYTRSGFDRGHMAPNYVIATRYGREAQLDTFKMTNISPQTPNLNQKSWQRLEEVIANDFSDWHDDFWVVTGPIFAKNPNKIERSGVAIPEAFYKILIKPSTVNKPAMALAFIFPQDAAPKASLNDFVSTIDEVEAKTNIDFFTKLEDEFEDKLEASKTPQAWRLNEVANRPSRY